MAQDAARAHWVWPPAGPLPSPSPPRSLPQAGGRLGRLPSRHPTGKHTGSRHHSYRTRSPRSIAEGQRQFWFPFLRLCLFGRPAARLGLRRGQICGLLSRDEMGWHLPAVAPCHDLHVVRLPGAQLLVWGVLGHIGKVAAEAFLCGGRQKGTLAKSQSDSALMVRHVSAPTVCFLNPARSIASANRAFCSSR